MILVITRKEFRELLRSGRFRWAASAIFALLAVSFTIGWRHHTGVVTRQKTTERMERERWLNKGAMHPHMAAHYGLYVFRPQSVLSTLDSGINSYTGLTSHLGAEEQKIFEFKPAQDGIAVQRIGELTAAATLQHLVPLLIILVLFPSFVGEREQGTLRQVLSFGINRGKFALAKVLGTVAPLLLFLVVPASFGVGALWLNTEGTGFAHAAPRLGVLALGYLVYFAIFVGLSLIVSARARSSQRALTVLLAIWFVNSVAAPPAIMNLIGYFYPEPNGFEFRAAVLADQRLGYALPNEQVRLQQQEQAELMNRKYGGSQETLRLSPEGINFLRFEERDTRLYEKHFSRLHNAYHAQSRAYQYGTVLAPLIGIQSLSMAMTASDFEHVRHFAEAAERYRRILVRTMNEDIALHDFPENRKPTGYWAGDVDYQAGPDLWQKVPPFVYQAPGLDWELRTQWPAMSLVFAWFALVAAITPLVVSRLRVD